MAAKKNKRVTKQGSLDPIQMLYLFIKMMGLASSPDQIKANYEVGESKVSIAIPSIKFALSFDNDKNVSLLEEDGWVVQRIFRRDMDAFSRIFSAVMEGRMAKTKMAMDPNIKNTSQDEERLLDAILRRGLPAPDRNRKFYKENGDELTVPDFTWEEYKICFFLDGAYWHSKVQDAELIKKLKSNAKIKNQVIASRSDKVAKDNNISSELTLLGYAVLRCTDEEISTDEGLSKQVDRIETLIERSRTAREYIVKDDGDEMSDLSDILGGSDDDEDDEYDDYDEDPTKYSPVSIEDINDSIEEDSSKEEGLIEEVEEEDIPDDSEDFLSSLFPDDDDDDS